MIELLGYTFVQKAFISGIFIAILSSVLGLFLVLRKMSLIGDGLSHASLGGIALGLLFGVYPFYVAVPFVVLSSLLILKIAEKSKVYGDAAIAIVSSATIAGAVIVVSLSNGFNVDLLSFLFGNILAVSTLEVISSVILCVFTLSIIAIYYDDLFYITFDESQAKVAGVNTKRTNYILAIVTSLAVVLSVKVVGVMLASSFLVLPAVTSLQISRSFKMAIGVSIVFSVIAVFMGILISLLLNLPTGATIVIVSFLLFITTFIYKQIS